MESQEDRLVLMPKIIKAKADALRAYCNVRRMPLSDGQYYAVAEKMQQIYLLGVKRGRQLK